MNKSALMRSGPSLIFLWLMPVLKAIAVVRLLVEPFEAFDLLGLPLQDFSFVIELPQLFIFQELKLFLGKFLHLFDALRVAIKWFKVLLNPFKKLLFLLLFVDIWVSLWLIFLNNFLSDLLTQPLLYQFLFRANVNGLDHVPLLIFLLRNILLFIFLVFFLIFHYISLF